MIKQNLIGGIPKRIRSLLLIRDICLAIRKSMQINLCVTEICAEFVMALVCEQKL